MTKISLEPYEVRMLEESATNLRDRLLIRLLFHLGCRISEALAIKVEGIDLVAVTVTIQHLKLRTSLLYPDCNIRLSKSNTYCPRCGSRVAKTVAQEKQQQRMRILPIDSDTKAMLMEYINHGGPVCSR